jgi:hypothetical protein
VTELSDPSRDGEEQHAGDEPSRHVITNLDREHREAGDELTSDRGPAHAAAAPDRPKCDRHDDADDPEQQADLEIPSSRQHSVHRAERANRGRATHAVNLLSTVWRAVLRW